MSDHVVVSGATGFIGAAVVRALLSRGKTVTALVRADSNMRRLHGFSVEKIEYTESNRTSIHAALRSRAPSTFIHCAWRGVSGSNRNADFQLNENVPMTLATVDLASAIGCSQWIGLGSQAEYGNQNVRLSEDAPLMPTTKYGEAKKEAGAAALSRCSSVGIAGLWFRIFSTYGPDDSPDWLIPYVIREFIANRQPHLTRCEQKWDYLYVDDAARAIAMVADGSMAGIFNLGSGTVYPLRSYVDAAQREVGSNAIPDYGAVPYRPDQVMHLEADISKLLAATTWSPRVGIAEGMRATVEFERQRLSHLLTDTVGST